MLEKHSNEVIFNELLIDFSALSQKKDITINNRIVRKPLKIK